MKQKTFAKDRLNYRWITPYRKLICQLKHNILSSRFGDEHAGENLTYLTDTQIILEKHCKEKEHYKVNG